MKEVQQRYDARKFNNGCPYLGRYTDPNHANSYRIITLLDEMDGDKRLARCEGIGGEGEPPSFILPAWINADNSIVIDFSVPPKGGPKDFLGNWEADGIKFVKDGNKWPMVTKQRNESYQSFVNQSTDGEPELTRDDFVTFYEELSLGFATDADFVDYLEWTWGVKTDSGLDLASVDALCQRLREAMVAAMDGEATNEAKQAALLVTYDTDLDGTLDAIEVQDMIAALGMDDWDRTLLGELMKRLDTDNDKTVNLVELKQFISAQ